MAQHRLFFHCLQTRDRECSDCCRYFPTKGSFNDHKINHDKVQWQSCAYGCRQHFSSWDSAFYAHGMQHELLDKLLRKNPNLMHKNESSTIC